MVLLAAVEASSKLEEAIRSLVGMAPNWVLRLLKPLLSFWWDDWL